VARLETVSTGFAVLDAALPGKGWPRAGLVEILISRVGVGEMCLLLPALAALTQRPSARWCAWISPPFEPFAPALAAQGVALERVFVARGESSSWAFEQSLASGACDCVMAWVGKPPAAAHSVDSRASAARPSVRSRARKNRIAELHAREIRRLQLAAERGRTLGVLFRPLRAAREFSNAVLRLLVQPTEQGARVTLLKSRGGQRGAIDLSWSSSRSTSSPQAHGS
jgi:cell division inhibitor SulA